MKPVQNAQLKEIYKIRNLCKMHNWRKFTKYETSAKCTIEGNLQNMKLVQNAQLEEIYKICGNQNVKLK